MAVIIIAAVLLTLTTAAALAVWRDRQPDRGQQVWWPWDSEAWRADLHQRASYRGRHRP